MMVKRFAFCSKWGRHFYNLILGLGLIVIHLVSSSKTDGSFYHQLLQERGLHAEWIWLAASLPLDGLKLFQVIQSNMENGISKENVA